MHRDERTLSTLVLIGFVFMVVGIGCALLGFIAGGPLLYIGTPMFFLGVLMAGGSTVYGLLENKKLSTTTDMSVFPDVYVVARFAVNEIGEMVFSDFFPEECKLYVRIQFRNGRSQELRTQMEVWERVPEGVRGTAHLQGDWLARFDIDARRAEG